MPEVGRREGYPSLAAREHWVKYAAGMAVEALFIIVLGVIALALAVLATVIWL